MRLVGLTTAAAALTATSAAAAGSAALAAQLLVPGHPLLAAAVAGCLVLLAAGCCGAAIGHGLARRLRQVTAQLAVVTDGALDALAPDARDERPAVARRPRRRRRLDGVRRKGTVRALPVREMQHVGDAFVALGARVRLADDLAERHRREADAAARGMVEMLSGLVAAEEGARGQLAAELHDTAAQSLATARRLGADRVERQAAPALPRQGGGPDRAGLPADTLDTLGSTSGGPAGVTDEATAAAISDLVAEAEESLRATMARARPPALRDGDLAAAVQLLRDDLLHRYGLEISLTWPQAAFPIPLALAVTVYRFFQEALLNVVKHADVDAAAAGLQVDEHQVVAVVSDAGQGFSTASRPAAGPGGRHVGLGLLRERARLAGGWLQVQSRPGGGTSLTLRLPRPALPLD